MAILFLFFLTKFAAVKNKKLSIIIALIFFACSIKANDSTELLQANNNDSIQLSLLTCGSGDDIYSYFGHTAIRYKDLKKNIDVVFNYGMFDFHSPNFIFRFVRGLTDYQLGVTDFEYFYDEYRNENREIWEQPLNLSRPEKDKLIARLLENYKPQNRIYRYNFLFDNCSTRPRDQIVESVNGILVFQDDMTIKIEDSSFRKIIHQYVGNHPWGAFGIDLLLGTKADKPISRMDMTFIPFYLQHFFNTATVKSSSGESKSLTDGNFILLDKQKANGQKSNFAWFTPLLCSLLMLAFYSILTLRDFSKKNISYIPDLFLFFLAGISGLVIGFLVFFSEHPAVSPNYLLFVFHPFYLFILPWVIQMNVNKLLSGINCIILTLFILAFPVNPQNINICVLPLTICLLERSLCYLVIPSIHKQ